LKVPNVSFNMLQKIMVGPFGDAFLKDVRKAKRPVFLWTVNDEPSMKWSIYKKVDGVITDDSKKFLEVGETYQGERVNLPVSSLIFIAFVNLMVTVFGALFRYRFGPKAEQRKARAALRG
jgi:phosphatidylglycerol phospholipase C